MKWNSSWCKSTLARRSQVYGGARAKREWNGRTERQNRVRKKAKEWQWQCRTPFLFLCWHKTLTFAIGLQLQRWQMTANRSRIRYGQRWLNARPQIRDRLYGLLYGWLQLMQIRLGKRCRHVFHLLIVYRLVWLLMWCYSLVFLFGLMLRLRPRWPQ